MAYYNNWKINPNLDGLKSMEDDLETWTEICEEFSFNVHLCKIYLLRGKFKLSLFQSDEARKFLNKSYKIAKEKDLVKYLALINEEKQKMSKLEELKQKPDTQVEYDHVKISEFLDYLKSINIKLQNQKL